MTILYVTYSTYALLNKELAMHKVILVGLILLTACESKRDRENREIVDRLIAQRRTDSLVRDSVESAETPIIATRPCDRPRPYKKWSNAEVSTALLEYSGKPESLELIREAGCRQ